MDAAPATTSEAAEKIKGWLSQPETEEQTPTEDTPETEPEVESQPEVRTFKVKVDGTEIDVPEDELLKGYSRTADYTRKTQALSEEKKALQAEAEAVKQERQKYAESLKLLEEQFKTTEKVDWARLREEDPIGYATKKLEERDRQDQLNAIQQEQQRIATLQAEEHQRALAKYVQEEQAKLADAIPEWKDAKVAKADQEKIRNHLLSIGYSEADIAQIYDHRAVVALRKAVLYDEMMSKAKSQSEKVKDSPKTLPPGNSAVGNRQYKETQEKFQKSGSVRDAAELIKQMLRT